MIQTRRDDAAKQDQGDLITLKDGASVIRSKCAACCAFDANDSGAGGQQEQQRAHLHGSGGKGKIARPGAAAPGRENLLADAAAVQAPSPAPLERPAVPAVAGGGDATAMHNSTTGTGTDQPGDLSSGERQASGDRPLSGLQAGQQCR